MYHMYICIYVYKFISTPPIFTVNDDFQDKRINMCS